MDFIRAYFNGEKTESLIIIGAGTIAVLVSLYWWMSIKKPFYTGLAFPMLFIGVIQVAVGTLVYLRSPRDTERVLNYMSLEPERIHSEEIPRMTQVMQNFIYYRYVELFLILAGILLLFFVPSSELIKGVGMGLFIQGALMLAADYFAERRGEEYLKTLRERTPALYEQS